MSTLVRRIGSLALVTWTVTQGGAALALTTNWNINSNGNFNTASNWNNGVPTSIDTAVFARGPSANYTVSFNPGLPGSPQVHSVLDLTIGSNNVTFLRNGFVGTASLAVANAARVGESFGDKSTLNTSILVTSGGAEIGDLGGSTGVWNVNASSVTLSGSGSGSGAGQYPLLIGNSGTGTLNIAAGASLTMSADAALGYAAGSFGTVNVSGTGASLTAGGLKVGESGSGTLNITNGGNVVTTSDFDDVGAQPNSFGVVTVDGTNSRWNTGAEMRIGMGGGTGRMHITGGAQMLVSAAVSVGDHGLGELVVDGAGSFWGTPGQLSIGDSGVGLLTASDGGTVQVGGAEIYGTGAITISGPNSGWAIAGNFDIGGTSGLVTINVTDGGRLSNGKCTLSLSHGATEVITVDGANSTWINSGDLEIDDTFQAAVNVTHGGHVDGRTHAIIGNGGANDAATVTVDGAGSLWSQTGDLTVGATSSGTLVVRNGGAVTVGGTLIVGSQGTLKANGTITGNVSNSGHVSLGNPPALLHIVGDYTQTASGALDLQLAGIIAGTQFDKVDASGTVSLTGTINVTLSPTFTPAVGNSFDIFDWGILTAELVTFKLPTLPGALTWDTTQFLSSGVISVVGPPVPGDYNGNGIVDAADYTIWRDTFGSTTDLRANGDNTGTSADKIDQADYDFWKATFGMHAGSGSSAGANAAVPEPGTLVLFLAGAVVLVARRGRERCVTPVRPKDC